MKLSPMSHLQCVAPIIGIQLFKLKSNGVKINSETIVEVWKDYVHIHYNETLAATHTKRLKKS